MMELEDLKKAWNKIPAEKSLNENQLKEMLGKHSRTMIDRIDRNIKIGFVIFFTIILVSAIYYIFVSPTILDECEIEVPQWILFIDTLSNALMLATFIYFAIKYHRIRKNCDLICDLKQTLKKIIDTLSIYKTLFYLALVALLFAICTAFLAGIYTGLTQNTSNHGIQATEVSASLLAYTLVIGAIGAVVIAGSLFLLLRWGFARLYGNYIQKLKETLKELEEIQD